MRKEDIETLKSPTKEQYIEQLVEAIEQTIAVASSLTLEVVRPCISRFKSHQLFRIYIRHLLCPKLSTFSLDLNALAEAVLHVGIKYAALLLEQDSSAPRWPLDSQNKPYLFVMLGLGKFGGCEMGFASDCTLCLWNF